MERVTGFKPVVSTLGKLHVTTTPNPRGSVDSDDYSRKAEKSQGFWGFQKLDFQKLALYTYYCYMI